MQLFVGPHVVGQVTGIWSCLGRETYPNIRNCCMPRHMRWVVLYACFLCIYMHGLRAYIFLAIVRHPVRLGLHDINYRQLGCTRGMQTKSGPHG
jgi:hypothetical protein